MTTQKTTAQQRGAYIELLDVIHDAVPDKDARAKVIEAVETYVQQMQPPAEDWPNPLAHMEPVDEGKN